MAIKHTILVFFGIAVFLLNTADTASNRNKGAQQPSRRSVSPPQSFRREESGSSSVKKSSGTHKANAVWTSLKLNDKAEMPHKNSSGTGLSYLLFSGSVSPLQSFRRDEPGSSSRKESSGSKQLSTLPRAPLRRGYGSIADPSKFAYNHPPPLEIKMKTKASTFKIPEGMNIEITVIKPRGHVILASEEELNVPESIMLSNLVNRARKVFDAEIKEVCGKLINRRSLPTIIDTEFPRKMDAFITDTLRCPPSVYVIARIGHNVHGMIGGWVRGNNEFLMRYFFVDGQFKNDGIGKMMLQTLFQTSCVTKIDVPWEEAFTNDERTEVHNFYEGLKKWTSDWLV